VKYNRRSVVWPTNLKRKMNGSGANPAEDMLKRFFHTKGEKQTQIAKSSIYEVWHRVAAAYWTILSFLYLY